MNAPGPIPAGERGRNGEATRWLRRIGRATSKLAIEVPVDDVVFAGQSFAAGRGRRAVTSRANAAHRPHADARRVAVLARLPFVSTFVKLRMDVDACPKGTAPIGAVARIAIDGVHDGAVHARPVRADLIRDCRAICAGGSAPPTVMVRAPLVTDVVLAAPVRAGVCVAIKRERIAPRAKEQP
jgi:hypothetical protein